MRTWIFTCCLLILTCDSVAQVARSRDSLLMGGRFTITIVAQDSLSAEQWIDTVITEIVRIEHLISDWKPSTPVSEINRNAGIRPVKVSQELLDLTERAITFSRLTRGAFDISFAGMERVWRFDGSMTKIPNRKTVKNAVKTVGYKNIIIDHEQSTIFLKRKGMKIGFGALGEGYAADRCRELMIRNGVLAGLVNATGDIQAWGHQPGGEPWIIGVSDPFHRGELLGTIALEGAITTSGSYEKYVIINNKRYSHIINPATGYPATGLTSVSVSGPSAEKANAFSTTMMVLGKKRAARLLRKFPEYGYLMITDKGERISHGLQIEPIDSF